jgi:transmembrane sensor
MEELKNIPEEIQMLISGFLTSSLNNEELVILNRWVSESEDHLKIFTQIKSTWLISGKPVKPDNKKITEAFQYINQKAADKPDQIRLHFWNISRIAASWVILFIVGAIFSTYLTHRDDNKHKHLEVTSVSAPLGSKSQVELPDGTRVWLNAGSKITYNNSFGGSAREVLLTGEAYFDVKRNEKSPFFVKTNKLVTIKVLGTAFNVKAYPEEDYVETTVERGKVQVSKSSPGTKGVNNPVTLLPNQKLTIQCKNNTSINNTAKKEATLNDVPLKHPEKEVVLQSNVETKVYTSWKDGKWIIESETLESIATMIERNYNINIEFKDPELKSYVFSGILKDETLDQVLELIKLSAPIKYHIKQRTVILTRNKSLYH